MDELKRLQDLEKVLSDDLVQELLIDEIVSVGSRVEGSPEGVQLCVNCNDIFAWGCADSQEITVENLPLLHSSIKECGNWNGALLFCARIRKMRPQGAAYSFIEKQNWPLFDACGPEREVDIGNPYHPGEYK